MDKVKTVLFARWLAMNYADTHIDSDGRSEFDEEFKKEEAISVLNKKNSFWYAERLKFYEEQVYPNQVKNKTVKLHEKICEFKQAH